MITIKNDCYYLVSDDRSAINPARFYTAHIDVSSKGIDSVYFTAITNMLQPNGKVYPSGKEEPANTPDPEAPLETTQLLLFEVIP